jgi:hypothetical protein
MIGHSAVEHPSPVLARLIPFPDQGKDMLLLELHFLVRWLLHHTQPKAHLGCFTQRRRNCDGWSSIAAGCA